MILHFNEINLPIGDIVSGDFNGQFYYDQQDRQIAYIQLDDAVKPGKVSVIDHGHWLFKRLAPVLLKEFATIIADRIAADQPYVDRYADFRLSKAQIGLRT